MESLLPTELVEDIHRINVAEAHHHVMAELISAVSWCGDEAASSLIWRRTHRAFADTWDAPGRLVYTLTTFQLVREPDEEIGSVASRSAHDCWNLTVDTRVLVERSGLHVEVGLLNYQIPIQHGVWGVTAHWEWPPFYVSA